MLFYEHGAAILSLVLAPIPSEILERLIILRLFNRKVEHLLRSGFARRYADEVPEVVATMAEVRFEALGNNQFAVEGRVSSRLADFDQDEIDAFVLTHRMFTQRNDPISIAALGDLYARKWMPEQGRGFVEDIRAEIADYLSRAATVMFGDDRIAVGVIVDVVIYGGMAHTNLEKSAIFESWSGAGFIGFIWAEFFAYARFMLGKLDQLRQINAQVLDAFDSGKVLWLVEHHPSD